MGIKFKVKNGTTIYEAFEHTKDIYMLQYYNYNNKPQYTTYDKSNLEWNLKSNNFIEIKGGQR